MQGRTFMRLAKLALALALPAGAAHVAESPRAIRLTIGSGHPAATVAYATTAQSFFQPEVSRRVAERTNYRIEWVEGYGGTIAKLAEGLMACQDGIIDILVNSYAFDNMRLFLMNMPFYVPFSSPDPILAGKASRATYEKHREVFEKLWETYNQKFLAFAPTGRYELITTFPVSRMSDIAGHKIAAAGANLPWLEGSGAIPVQSNLNEAYISLQTGVYDGWVMHPDSAYRYKLHEAARHYTLVGFGAESIQGMSINLDVYNGLPPEIREIILETAGEYEVKSAEMSREWDAAALAGMARDGVAITELPPEERRKWVMGLPEIPNIRSREANGMGFPGTEIWKDYIRAQKELGHVFPREWRFD